MLAPKGLAELVLQVVPPSVEYARIVRLLLIPIVTMAPAPAATDPTLMPRSTGLPTVEPLMMRYVVPVITMNREPVPVYAMF